MPRMYQSSADWQRAGWVGKAVARMARNIKTKITRPSEKKSIHILYVYLYPACNGVLSIVHLGSPLIKPQCYM